MSQKQRDFDVLAYSGTVIRGAGKILYADGEFVGHYVATTDGLHHILDADGHRVDVFASREEADAFARSHWKIGGTFDRGFSPPKLQ